MSYVIFGRAVKNEYLTLATFFTTGAIAYAAASFSGSKKEKPSLVKGSLEQMKGAVPINAGSSEEEEFIKNYIAEAEKETKQSH